MAENTTHEHSEHEHSATPYFVVWIVLLFFTLLTYITGKQHWGALALPLAMLIACIKAGLVAAIFMHLRERGGGMLRLVLASSLVFVGLLIALSWADVATRFHPATPQGAPFGTEGGEQVVPSPFHGDERPPAE